MKLSVIDLCSFQIREFDVEIVAGSSCSVRPSFYLFRHFCVEICIFVCLSQNLMLLVAIIHNSLMYEYPYFKSLPEELTAVRQFLYS